MKGIFPVMIRISEYKKCVSKMWTGMKLKEAAAFLAFLISGDAMDSNRRVIPGIIFLAAAAVLYGQAGRKEKNEKEDSAVEGSGSSTCSPDYL